MDITTPSAKIRLGVSACLLGQKVRYDGSHKYNDFINLSLARFFDFVPVCPEVGIGMSVPRSSIRLIRLGEEIRAVGVKEASLDVTEKLNQYLHQVAPELTEICGYILKKGSPSCGMERVTVYRDGLPLEKTAGLYAASLLREYPLLPVEEEGRLHDPVLRENFITRVLVYHRWQELSKACLSASALVNFHASHKLLIMAHSQAGYRRLGQLVAEAGKHPLAQLGASYFAELMPILKRRATPQSHTNVLQHLMGYLKRDLDAGDKAELVEVIDRYRREELPLIVPITLLKHHFRRHPNRYVENQIYLAPHPAELMLHNAI